MEDDIALARSIPVPAERGQAQPMGSVVAQIESAFERKAGVGRILTFNANKNISLMANYDFGKDYGPNLLPGVRGPEADWQGIAGYFKAKVSDHFTFAGRYEWFDDRIGFMTGTPQELQSFTETAMVPWKDMTFWAEFRRDWSDAASFHSTDPGVFAPVQKLKEQQNTITLGLTYAFTKEVK